MSRRFFALPESERRSIEMANSPHFRGYTALGNELTQGRPDWREEVDIGEELPARQAPDDPPYWGLQGPNQWPAALPEFRPAMLDWLERLRAVAADLAQAFAESLGLARNYSIPFFYNPRFDYVVEPIEFPAHILPPISGEPPVDPANPIFAEYGYNALKGRLRSHRDVAARFYAELDRDWGALPQPDPATLSRQAAGAPRSGANW